MPMRYGMALVLLCAPALPGRGAEPPAKEGKPAERIAYGAPRLLCRLANLRVNESSGLACGRANKGIFWTHNDSGDGPFLYAFNVKGETLGTFSVPGARARDWEDMASFTRKGKHYLLIADTGDNLHRYRVYTLYVVEEPVLPAKPEGGRGRAKLVRTIFFRFEGGPRDGEGVAIDATSGTIFIATRTYIRKCEIFALPLGEKPANRTLTAKLVATVPVRVGNGMDVSPDGRRAVVNTYSRVYEFQRAAGENWRAAFRRRPRAIRAPVRLKGESVAYGPDGRTLYLTSEGSPCPLWVIPVKAPEKPQ